MSATNPLWSATNFPPKGADPKLLTRLPVACPSPHCGASIGVMCRTRDGQKASKVHTPRIERIHDLRRQRGY